MGAITRDTLLGGRVALCQPAAGFRSGIDAVLLAAAVPARAGQRVLDLGCGAGAAVLCVAARVPGIEAWGLEVQPAYADLARRNAAAAGLAATILTGDVAAPPAALKAATFDHVLANPPYFAAGARHVADDAGRELARGESAPVAVWIDAAIRRLRPGGTLTLIQRAERMPDCLAACDGRVGGVRLLPLAPRRGRAARLFLLRATKSRKTPFVLLAPLTLHAGARHPEDRDHYTPEIAAVLQDAVAIPEAAWAGTACEGKMTEI